MSKLTYKFLGDLKNLRIQSRHSLKIIARGRIPKNSFSFLIKWKNFPEPEWTDYNYTLPATAPFQQYCTQYPNLRMTS